MDGKPAYQVILTPKTGGPQTIYFDRESLRAAARHQGVDKKQGRFADRPCAWRAAYQAIP